jgi:hypothetical protein
VNWLRLFLLVGGLGLAGCAPSADPMDWKIQGDSVDDIDRWMAKNVPLMPPELGAEFSVCVNNIQASTAGSAERKANAVSRQLDGQSVRQVLIAGHELANNALAARIDNESNALLRIARLDDSLPADQREKQEKFHRAQLALYQQKMTEAEKRLAELRAPILAGK